MLTLEEHTLTWTKNFEIQIPNECLKWVRCHWAYAQPSAGWKITSSLLRSQPNQSCPAGPHKAGLAQNHLLKVAGEGNSSISDFAPSLTPSSQTRRTTEGKVAGIGAAALRLTTHTDISKTCFPGSRYGKMLLDFTWEQVLDLMEVMRTVSECNKEAAF